MNWIEDAVSYISEIVNDNYVLPLQDVLSEIHRAPALVANALQNLERLEQFLKSHGDRFIVENGKVAVHDSSLEEGRKKAVVYFEKELDNCDTSPHYLNFRKRVALAEDDVICFTNTFYFKEEFKNFLLAHPEVFFVLDDDTVRLTKNETVEYFEKCLEGKEGLPFQNLRGHLGQAPRHVVNFIKTRYPGESFLEFLENNPEVFLIDAGHVSLKTDWVEDAVLYITKILNGGAIPLQDVLSKILYAPVPVRKSLGRWLRNLQQLENFLKREGGHFIVENGKVTAYDPDLATSRKRAIVYFEKELKRYDGLPHYLSFRGCIGQAGDDVIHFINTFYPNEEFKNFLLAHPDVFFVFVNETVSPINYINSKSLNYLKKLLKKKQSLHFMKLRGHPGQNPSDVIEFINTQYPGKSLLEFLTKYSDIFFVLEDDTVFLINYLNCESVDYFVKCLESREGLFFMDLRGHLGQAPPHVIEFVNTRYPKKSFLKFLKNNSAIFFVFEDKTVHLKNYLNCESVDYFQGRLKNREGVYFENLRGHLGQAPPQVIEFINTQYPGKSLLEFFKTNSHVFFVRGDEIVSLLEKESVDYFAEYLKNREGMFFMDIRNHLGQAPNHVIEFINARYPGENFLKFLKNNSSIFFVFEDKTVSLINHINNESVDYFQGRLKNREDVYFENLRGHLAQAPLHVIEFINTRYPKKNFLEFLKNNSDVFFVFQDKTVSLVNHINCESVDYFQGRLEDREGVYIKNMRGHLGQAPPHVIEFINTQYPGKSLLEFFKTNSDVFFVFDDEMVCLLENA